MVLAIRTPVYHASQLDHCLSQFGSVSMQGFFCTLIICLLLASALLASEGSVAGSQVGHLMMCVPSVN